MSEKKVEREMELDEEMKAIVTIFGEQVCLELVDCNKDLTCVTYFKSKNAAKKLGELLSSL